MVISSSSNTNPEFQHLTEDLAKFAETKEVIRDLELERVNG